MQNDNSIGSTSLASLPPAPSRTGPAVDTGSTGVLDVPGVLQASVAPGQASAPTASLFAASAPPPRAAGLTSRLQHGTILDGLNTYLDSVDVVQLSNTCGSWRAAQRGAIASRKETLAEITRRAQLSIRPRRWGEIVLTIWKERASEALWLCRRIFTSESGSDGRRRSSDYLLGRYRGELSLFERLMLDEGTATIEDQHIDAALATDPSAFFALLRAFPVVGKDVLSKRKPAQWVSSFKDLHPAKANRMLADLCGTVSVLHESALGPSLDFAERIVEALPRLAAPNTPLTVEKLANMMHRRNSPTRRQAERVVSLMAQICRIAAGHGNGALGVVKAVMMYCRSVHTTDLGTAKSIWKLVADFAGSVSVEARLPFLLALWPAEDAGAQWTEQVIRVKEMVAALPTGQARLANAVREVAPGRWKTWEVDNIPPSGSDTQDPVLPGFISSLNGTTSAFRLDAYRLLLEGMRLSPFALPDTSHRACKVAMSTVRNDLIAMVLAGKATAECLFLLGKLHQWDSLVNPKNPDGRSVDAVVASAVAVASSIAPAEAVLFWSGPTVELALASTSCIAGLLVPLAQSYRLEWVNGFVDYWAKKLVNGQRQVQPRCLSEAMTHLNVEGRGSVLRRLILRRVLGPGLDTLQAWVVDQLHYMPAEWVGRLRMLQFSVAAEDAYGDYVARVASLRPVDGNGVPTFEDDIILFLADIWTKAMLADAQCKPAMEQQLAKVIAQYQEHDAMKTMLDTVKGKAEDMISNLEAARKVQTVTASANVPTPADSDPPARETAKRRRED
jgi:hypothetical protein